MRTIPDYIAAIDTVLANVEQETARIVEYNKDEILNLNREDQLFKRGIDSDERFLGNYSPNTIRAKMADPLVSRISQSKSLFNHGDFYRGFDILFRYPSFSIFSRDPKSSELQDDYGNSIFGLTRDNAHRVNYEIIKPELDKFLMKYL